MVICEMRTTTTEINEKQKRFHLSSQIELIRYPTFSDK